MVNISYSQLGAVKRALKNLENADIEKSVKLVSKALEKDSLLPAALYVRSRVLFDSANAFPDIDSAYHYILFAQENFGNLESKDKDQHNRAGFDSTTMELHKQKIDSAAFVRASRLNSESAFIYFIKNFSTARQMPLAISARNALAYAAARRENTYQSYARFFRKYPQAVEVREARKRYEKLYYMSRTLDGKLKSYVRFLDEHTDTPYREEIEAHIFKIATADHSAKSYLTFIKKFPKSKMTTKAINYLYHVLKEHDQKLPENLLTDSLKKVVALEGKMLVPVWEDGKYGFINAEGEELPYLPFGKIGENELCGGITRDYLLFNKVIVGLNQVEIFHGAYDEVEDLGYGLLKISHNGKMGVVHKSGSEILPMNNDDIKLLMGKFLAFKKGNDWGLTTVSRKEIVAPRFSNIIQQGPFMLFEKDDRFAVKNEKALIKSIDNNILTFDIRFDDFEWISENQLWLSFSGKETILGTDLSEIIPLDTQTIRVMKKAILIDKNDQIYLLDNNFRPIDKEPALSAKVSDFWVALEGKSDWLLYETETYKLRYDELDSVKLLGNDYALIYKNDSAAILTREKPLVLAVGETPSLISAANADQYILIEEGNTTSAKRLVNIKGATVFSGTFDEAKPIGENFIVISRDGKNGMISGDARLLLEVKYDAIGNYRQGSISFLKDRKFGLINPGTGSFIPAEYEKNILTYNDEIFIAEKEHKKGLINKDNKALSSFEYDEIVYWSDSVAFVKQGVLWSLYNFKSQSLIDEGIRSMKVIIENENERLAVILKKSGYGLISNVKGEVISAIYNDIKNIGTQYEPVYFTERHISEAEYYIIIYYNKDGQVIRRQALDSSKYSMIYCED